MKFSTHRNGISRIPYNGSSELPTAPVDSLALVFDVVEFKPSLQWQKYLADINIIF